MPTLRAPVLALALLFGATAIPTAQAAAPISLEAPNGLYTLAITAAPGGGFALAAQELIPYPGGTDPRVHVFRYEAGGRLRWERIIDRKGPQIVKAMTYGPGETLYLAGVDGSDLTTMSYQSLFAAIAPNGEILENKTFGEPAPVEDWTSGLAMTTGGDLIAVGRVKIDLQHAADMQVMELDSGGNIKWRTSLKGAAEESYPLVAYNAAGTFVAGTYPNARVFVQRVDNANGALRPFASFSTPKRVSVAQMTVLPSGDLVMGLNLSGGDNQARLVRVNGSGSVSWDVAIPGNTALADITRLPSGLIVVAGTTDDSDRLTHSWLRAFDEQGKTIGEIKPDYDGETRAGGVTSDGEGGVYFAYSPIDESIPAKPEPVIVEKIRVQ